MTDLVTEEELVRSIRGHLPQLLRSDPSLGDYVLSVGREHFPSKVETEDRFTRMLNELARDREARSRKWEEQKEENRRRWEEQDRKWEQANQRFDKVDRGLEKLERSIGGVGRVGASNRSGPSVMRWPPSWWRASGWK